MRGLGGKVGAAARTVGNAVGNAGYGVRSAEWQAYAARYAETGKRLIQGVDLTLEHVFYVYGLLNVSSTLRKRS